MPQLVLGCCSLTAPIARLLPASPHSGVEHATDLATIAAFYDEQLTAQGWEQRDRSEYTQDDQIFDQIFDQEFDPEA
jgi:hypothetical protein